MIGWLIVFGYIVMGGIISALSERCLLVNDVGFIIACWLFWPVFVGAYIVIGIFMGIFIGWKFIAGTL